MRRNHSNSNGAGDEESHSLQNAKSTAALLPPHSSGSVALEMSPDHGAGRHDLHTASGGAPVVFPWEQHAEASERTSMHNTLSRLWERSKTRCVLGLHAGGGCRARGALSQGKC